MDTKELTLLKEEKLNIQLSVLTDTRSKIKDEIDALHQLNNSIFPTRLASYLALVQSLEITCREERAVLMALDSLATSGCTDSTTTDT